MMSEKKMKKSKKKKRQNREKEKVSYTISFKNSYAFYHEINPYFV